MPEQVRVSLPEYRGEEPTGETIEIAYRDLPANRPDAPVLVMIHGSPMGSQAMNNMIEQLRGDYRLIVPDLPGFGGSTLKVDDYSVLTHAHNLRDLLDHLQIDHAHILGYSQGGGVILEFADRNPEMTQSLIMVAAIGVQELELLGDYTLNHAIYSTQWLLFWLLENFTPHFGYIDEGLLNVAYARNFSDTDQRPLRGALERYAGPMLILHGQNDVLVPLAAAEEHARLVPQSKLAVEPNEGHIFPFTHPKWVKSKLEPFIKKIERGEATLRSTVEQGSSSNGSNPAGQLAAATGKVLLFYCILLIIGTLISEDLTCIAAGILASQGIIGFWPATAACLVGIFFGDLWLFYAGRWLGRPAIKRAPFKWFLNERDVDGAEQWFHRRGAALIFFTRFIPGARLPTYFAAGVLRSPLKKFIFYFMLAAAIWTPALVGLSMVMGQTFLGFFEKFEKWAPLAFVGFVITMLMATRILAPLLTWEGRRLLLSRWQRMTKWEFWPMWAFYPPVFFYVIFQGLRYRCPPLFTAVNPAMPEGGFSEESKSAILDGLKEAGDVIGRWESMPALGEDRLGALEAFMKREDLTYPIVLKPNEGQRGEGVAVIKDREQAADYLNRCQLKVIAQEFLPGREYGIFYYRYPNQETGVLWGITDKRFTSVTGDGENSLRHLILADPRAVCAAQFFLRRHAEDLATVPDKDEVVVLAELGTHCRGAVFLDGSHLITDVLSQKIDEISRTYDGFYFGRYDVRAENDEALQRGDFRVIELNGVTSEATWIYDPKHSVFFGWKTLLRQWKIAFEIADQNRRNGFPPAKSSQVLYLLFHLRDREVFEA